MKSSRGFTLIEVIIALVALSIILTSIYGAFFLADSATKGGESSMTRLQEARTTLDYMRREIESALFSPEQAYTSFKLEDRDIYGRQASRLAFTTQTPTTMGLVSVTYYINESDRKFTLMKELRRPFGKPSTEIEPEDIAEEIDFFMVEVRGADGKWVKTWDATTSGKLPEEIKITIGVKIKERVVSLFEFASPMTGKNASAQ